MGLYATIQIVEDFENNDAELKPDYGPAVRRFAEAFMSRAQELCPVRTGYLRSTISAQVMADGTVICRADADYAEYVEYGTSRQHPQPFFEPAIDYAQSMIGGEMMARYKDCNE